MIQRRIDREAGICKSRLLILAVLAPLMLAGRPGVVMGAPVRGFTLRISVGLDGREANRPSFGGALSADGRRVALESDAYNLVAGDTNGRRDIFVWDRTRSEMTRVSVAGDGTQANDYSGSPAIGRRALCGL